VADDWIKMRASLLTNPKVTALCKLIENSKAVGKRLSTGFGGALREIVTRDVTRDVTVASLFRVWCAANEHTSDGVWHGIELDDLDHVAGIPGFGDMMEAVGWAVVDVDNQTVTFPNFLEYNAPAKDGRGSSAAERQRRYREKHRAKRNGSDVTRDVTHNVTGDGKSDVEKRREEESNKKEKQESGSKAYCPYLQNPEFAEVAESYLEMRTAIHGDPTASTVEAWYYELCKLPISEAIDVLRFSTSCESKKPIMNGDHKKKNLESVGSGNRFVKPKPTLTTIADTFK
jgi:hypothetical protein